MLCYKCNGKTKVTDSRTDDVSEHSVHRKRCCKVCGFRFTTIEYNPADILELQKAQAELTQLRTKLNELLKEVYCGQS